MAYEGSRVARMLGIKFPLIQAPMSWVTDARLVAAVSEAGGLGVLGPNAGYSTLAKDPDETIERMRSEIRKVLTLTDKPFGLNVLLMSDESLDEFTQKWVRMASDEGVRHFVSVGNACEQAFGFMKELDGIIIHRPLTPTVANMRQAEALGADVLVATGYDEGGLIPASALGTFTVVPTMVDAVRVPVMATGGINDRRGVKAAFALGAEGVYIGTRFIVTQESPAADNVKNMIITSGYADMQSVSPLQRSIRTRTSDRLAALYLDKQNTLDLDLEIRKLGGLRPSMLAGDLDEGIVSVNTGIDVIKSNPTVKELIADLLELN
ncbi:nitronate monooxygenase [Pseudomonas putida]|uniref:nitronate monooxygenase n=1 Tax=Pseudomonas putida TaxID=303 RepID=UPI002363B445|nr:nitronate monooxygenase [Pseudomonas putida]MDD1963828.1 nitronate monooxygenase [Pseudomonas putida]